MGGGLFQKTQDRDGTLSAFSALETSAPGAVFRVCSAGLSVEAVEAQLSGCKCGKRPSFLPAAFREARGGRALRRGERCPAESAMASVVRRSGPDRKSVV